MALTNLKKKFDNIKERHNKIKTLRRKIAAVKRKIQKSKDHKNIEILKQKLKESL